MKLNDNGLIYICAWFKVHSSMLFQVGGPSIFKLFRAAKLVTNVSFQ